MIEPVIREAGIADIESLLPLVEEFVTSFAVDREAFRTSFQKLIVDDSALILVAEAGGVPAGSSGVMFTQRSPRDTMGSV